MPKSTPMIVLRSFGWKYICLWGIPVRHFFVLSSATANKQDRRRLDLRRLFTKTLPQLQGPRVLNKLTGRAWEACVSLEPSDVMGADGVDKIMKVLKETFVPVEETELFDYLEEVLLRTEPEAKR